MPILTIDGLNKSFGPTQVLHDIALSVSAGEVVSVLGPSGSGKSTMLRVINGLESHDSGTVTVEGVTLGPKLGARGLAALRARVGMVFQGFHLWPHKTILDNVAEGPIQVQRKPRRDALALAAAQLERVGLGALTHRYPAQLSGGQQQRAAIARALAMEPVMILFDEPTSALDPQLAGEVLDTMTGLAESGTTMLVVTHEMRFARKVSQRVVFMADGRIVSDTGAERFFSSSTDPRAAAFLQHA